MNLFTWFGAPHALLFLCGVLCVLISIVLAVFRQRYKPAMLLLVAGTLLTNLFAILLDPFLNYWDEQVHALVAKNLMHDPLYPVLYRDPHLAYDYTNWIQNHVWLHKQPLFLWQIALSLKIFGTSAYAVRIPSLLMMSILPWFIYRIGTISINQRTGFFAALLLASSFYIHQLVSGALPSDHNDVAFLFYITLSIWAFTQYLHTEKAGWAVLAGIFSGLAILVKWLVGLLVFSGWGLALITDKYRRNKTVYYRHMLLALLACILISLPWQLYISYRWPVESAHEYSLNTMHFTGVVEGHRGGWLFYWDQLESHYSMLPQIAILIVISFGYFIRKLKTAAFRVALPAYVLIVFAFFTLAQTKMPGFTFIVSPLIFLSLAAMLDSLFSWLSRKGPARLSLWLTTILLSVVTWFNYNLPELARQHTTMLVEHDMNNRRKLIKSTEVVKRLDDILPPEDYILFNAKPLFHIPVMFYTDHIAYERFPEKQEFDSLKQAEIPMAVFVMDTVPDYLMLDTAVIKIQHPFANGIY